MIPVEAFASATSLVEFASSELKNFVTKLLDANLVINQGASIDWDAGDIEFRIFLGLGGFYERTKPENQILSKIQKYFQNDIVFKNVRDIWGTGLTYSENLKQMGIIVVKGTTATLSLGQMISKVKSEVVILSFREKLLEDLKVALISPNITHSMRQIENQILEGHFSISLDYANLWHKSLDSFSVKNIIYNFDFTIQDVQVEGAFSPEFRRRTMAAFKKLPDGDKNAIAFTNTTMRVFMTFESRDLVAKLATLFSVDPSDQGEILGVIPRMQIGEVVGTKYPINIPGVVTIRLRTQIREGEAVTKGRILFDGQRFNSMIKEMVNKIERETRHLTL